MIWNSANIKFLRRRMGWSQADLARRLQIESIKVTQWEQGHEPPQPTAIQMLEHLNCLAEIHAQEIKEQSLSESFFSDEETQSQVDISAIKKRFAA